MQFEAAFEQAGKPNFQKRKDAATEYYNLYSGSTYTGNYDGSVGTATAGSTTDSTTGTTSTSSTSSSTSSSGNILETILSAFSNAFTKALGGSTDDSTTTTTTDSTGTSTGTTTTTDATAAASSVVPNGDAQSFIDVAKSQLGTVEEYDNITPYGKFTGMDGEPWCASFVSWCMDQAFGGDSAKGKKALRGGYSAAVSTLWDQFKNAGAMTMSPQPGDVVIYKNGTSHTGLVESVDGDNVTTIEGNTSGGNGFERNGGMVAEKTFNINEKSQLTGFGRPDWEGAAAGAGSGLLDKLDRATAVARSHMKAQPVQTQKTKPVAAMFSRSGAGTDETVTKTATTTSTTSTTSNATNTNNSTINTSVVAALKTIIQLVKNISENTSNIPNLGTTLTNYCEAKLTTDVDTAKSNISNSNEETSKVNPEDDPALQDLMATLGAIAAG
jgi:hypothetical protein